MKKCVVLAKEIPCSHIPDLAPNCVACIHGYGNLKTTIQHESSNTYNN